MTDDLEPLRRARPDRLLPDDPPDPEILAREKARLMSAITGPEGVVVHRRTPSIYPRLAYRDEVAALDFLTRASTPTTTGRNRRAPGSSRRWRTCSGATGATRPSTWRGTDGTSPSACRRSRPNRPGDGEGWPPPCP